jgi:hypothetical protein
MLYRILLSISIICYFLGNSTISSANQFHVEELNKLDEIQSKLDIQRQWVNYRYEKALADCYSFFWMQRCSDKARLVFLNEIKQIRDQEIALHNRQREVNEFIKDEKDQQRFADYADPQKVKERAENRANFEEKQRLRSEREAELEQRRKDAEKRAKENRNTSPLD